MELAPGRAPPGSAPTTHRFAREQQLKTATIQPRWAAEITAVAPAGETVYAGASDGRIWVSFDPGAPGGPSPRTGRPEPWKDSS